MIGIGIVGSNYGRTVLLPAFRTDARCEVVALAGSNAARTAEHARAANVARGLGDWRALVDDPAVAAVAIAVPPDLQPAIAQRALDRGKPVFAEKPFAATDDPSLIPRPCSTTSSGLFVPPRITMFEYAPLIVSARVR